MTELKGDTSTGKDRSVKCSLEVKRKIIHLFFQAAHLRKIDLSAQQEKVEIFKAKGIPLMVLKFDVGYDLALEMDSGDVYLEVSCLCLLYIYTLPAQEYLSTMNLCHKWLLTKTHMPLQIYRNNTTSNI